MIECPILTDIGIRAPDVFWASARSMSRHKGMSPVPHAPEICVEIISPSSVAAEITEKTRAYLAAGAEEVWLVSDEGTIRYIDRSSDRARSGFPVTVSFPLKGYP